MISRIEVAFLYNGAILHSHMHIAKIDKKIYSQYMIAKTVTEALIAETVHGFTEKSNLWK